ncbi:class I SAM-dependent methyltransferase [Actinoallomurus purpureus]|uniref:class I SAM-dependent methyltransferase n=1 Tax=Actinoallomurus purpureus TaxID=478114 RepID=UPI002093DC35|nr:class I SAM-dependent methyltransferase [Actinoallomurus purpureus]MCO6008402.1 class I SAM-dependent methyltransferase [Actinoallomurus purpureus]
MLAEAMARTGQMLLRGIPPNGNAYWANRFWDRDAAERHPDLNAEFEHQKSTISEYFKKYAQDAETAVEFACGTGEFTRLTAELTKVSSITALDISEQGLERTRQKVRHDDLTLIKGDFWADHGLARSDLVVCVDAIHHLGDVKDVLKRLRSFVKPGGVFIGNALILDRFHEFERCRYGTVGHFNRTAQFLATAVMVRASGGRLNTGAYRTQLRTSKDIRGLLDDIFPEVLDVSVDPYFMAFACRV